MAGRKKPERKEEPTAKTIVVNDQIDETEGSLSPEQKAAMLDSLKNIDFIPQETQDKLAAQLAQRVYEDLPEDLEAAAESQKEEISKLMTMPLSQIAKLPEDKRALVYAEMGRQLIETPGLSESVSALVEIGKRMAEATDGEYIDALAEAGKKAINGIDGIRETISRIADAGQNLFQPLQALGTALEDARKSLATALIGDREDAPQILAELAPYIKAEREENPDKYGETAEQPASANELIASAAASARADGLDIPPLRVEEPDTERISINEPIELALISRPGEQRQREATPTALLEQIQNIPQIERFNIRYHTSPITKLSNKIKDIVNSGAEQPITVSKKSIKNRITTTAYIETLGKDVSIKGSYTAFDDLLNDTIGSVYLYGPESHIVTDTQIWRAMNMKTDSETPTESQLKELRDSLDRQRTTLAEIDAKEEIKKYCEQRGLEFKASEAKWRSTLLSMKELQIRDGKNIRAAYQILEKPILLQYAEATNKQITSPVDLLDIKRVDRNGIITTNSEKITKERNLLRNYYWKRIKVMEKDEKDARESKRKFDARRKKDKTIKDRALESFRDVSRTIVFDTAFKESDINIDPEKEGAAVTKKRYRDFVEKMLTFWIAKGFIKGYSVKRKDREIYGVEIEIP